MDCKTDGHFFMRVSQRNNQKNLYICKYCGKLVNKNSFQRNEKIGNSKFFDYEL